MSRDFANRLASWHHSGFHVYCSRPVHQDDKPALERLAAYILRPSFAASRLHFDPKRGQIEYRTKKGLSRCMDALNWIALVTSHIPDSHEQMIRYYGRYSNASRGKRRQALALRSPGSQPDCDDLHSQAEAFATHRRANWARLLEKIYEVDPLTCLQCGKPMRIIAFIEDPRLIRRILLHLGSWQRLERSPPPPTLCPQAGGLPGHSLPHPGPTGSDLHRLHLLGRRARLRGLSSRASRRPPHYPCV